MNIGIEFNPQYVAVARYPATKLHNRALLYRYPLFDNNEWVSNSVFIKDSNVFIGNDALKKSLDYSGKGNLYTDYLMLLEGNESSKKYHDCHEVEFSPSDIASLFLEKVLRMVRDVEDYNFVPDSIHITIPTNCKPIYKETLLRCLEKANLNVFGVENCISSVDEAIALCLDHYVIHGFPEANSQKIIICETVFSRYNVYLIEYNITKGSAFPTFEIINMKSSSSELGEEMSTNTTLKNVGLVVQCMEEVNVTGLDIQSFILYGDCVWNKSFRKMLGAIGGKYVYNLDEAGPKARGAAYCGVYYGHSSIII